MAFTALGRFATAVSLVLCCTVHVSGKRRFLVDVEGTSVPDALYWRIFRFLGYFSPGFFIPVFAQAALGLYQKTSLDVIIIFNAASVFGRSLGPPAAAHITVMLPWLVCSMAAGILCLAWPAINTFGGFVAVAVLHGLVSGPLTVFPPVVVPLFCPSPNVIGTRMAMLWESTAFAFLLGTPIAATISDTSNGHFLGLQLFTGVTLLVGALSLLPLWTPIRKQQQQSTSSPVAPRNTQHDSSTRYNISKRPARRRLR